MARIEATGFESLKAWKLKMQKKRNGVRGKEERIHKEEPNSWRFLQYMTRLIEEQWLVAWRLSRETKKWRKVESKCVLVASNDPVSKAKFLNKWTFLTIKAWVLKNRPIFLWFWPHIFTEGKKIIEQKSKWSVIGRSVTVQIIFRRIMCVYVICIFPYLSIYVYAYAYIYTHVFDLFILDAYLHTVYCVSILHFFPPQNTQFPRHLKKSSWPPKRDPPQGPTAPRPARSAAG